MAIGGGTGAPSKGVFEVKDPKKNIQNLSKKSFGIGNKGAGKLAGNIPNPSDVIPLPPGSDWNNPKNYCIGCGGSATIIVEEDIIL